MVVSVLLQKVRYLEVISENSSGRGFKPNVNRRLVVCSSQKVTLISMGILAITNVRSKKNPTALLLSYNP